MPVGISNNKVTAERILGKLTHEQQLTLEDLTHVAVYHDMVTRFVLTPQGVKNGGLMHLELAPIDSFYRGQYTWMIDAYIEEDGTLEVDAGDEVFIDSLDEVLTRVHGHIGEPVIKRFER